MKKLELAMCCACTEGQTLSDSMVNLNLDLSVSCQTSCRLFGSMDLLRRETLPLHDHVYALIWMIDKIAERSDKAKLKMKKKKTR